LFGILLSESGQGVFIRLRGCASGKNRHKKSPDPKRWAQAPLSLAKSIGFQSIKAKIITVLSVKSKKKIDIWAGLL
jgi:hypothetical protein